jgi:hypothetical protein
MNQDILLPVDLLAEALKWALCRVSGLQAVMTAFEGWTSPAGQIGNAAFPPTAADFRTIQDGPPSTQSGPSTKIARLHRLFAITKSRICR